MVRLAWPGWWLGLLVGVGTPVAAQANVAPPRIELKENYPNPFFPTTTIPFLISQEVCARGHQPVVSLKIYNVLVQSAAALRRVPRVLGREVSGWSERGNFGCVLLPAHRGWGAVHPQDDRAEEGDQPAMRGTTRGPSLACFGCQCGRDLRYGRCLGQGLDRCPSPCGGVSHRKAANPRPTTYDDDSTRPNDHQGPGGLPRRR